MKEKIKKSNTNEIEPLEKISLLKALKELFIQPDLGEEEDNKKAISQSYNNVISSDQKKELYAALEIADSIMESTNGGFSFKRKNDLRVSDKETKKYLEKNPIHLDTKYHIDKQTGNIIKTNNTKISNKNEDIIR